MQIPIENLLNKTTFIVGRAKDSGKTTLLNFLLVNLREKLTSIKIIENFEKSSQLSDQLYKFVYMSIGIDGEGKDILFQNLKPKILAKPEDYVVTCSLSLKVTDAQYDVVHVFPFNTVLGKIVLVKIIREGFIEIVGPETNSQLESIVNFINDFGIKTILIDGAINRITQISKNNFDKNFYQNCEQNNKTQFYFVTKINNQNLNSEISYLEKLTLTTSLPVFNSDDSFDENIFCVEGALSSSKFSQMKNLENQKIIIEDFTKFFISLNEIKILLKKNLIFLRKQIPCAGIAIIDYDINESTREIIAKSTKLPLYFNPYKVIEKNEI